MQNCKSVIIRKLMRKLEQEYDRYDSEQNRLVEIFLSDKDNATRNIQKEEADKNMKECARKIRELESELFAVLKVELGE